MNRRVLTRIAVAVGVLMASSTVGHAADLKVFTSVALKQALNELSPIFEQKTGNKLSISYDLACCGVTSSGLVTCGARRVLITVLMIRGSGSCCARVIG